jgi:hypothetical protein
MEKFFLRSKESLEAERREEGGDMKDAMRKWRGTRGREEKRVEQRLKSKKVGKRG